MVAALSLVSQGDGGSFGKTGRSVKVAVCQIRCVDSDIEGNIVRVTRAVEEAAARQAEVVAFPETVFIGWVNTDAHKLAEPIPGPTTDALEALARESGLERWT